MQPESDFFQCLICGGLKAQVFDAMWVCDTCAHTYPVEQGLPLLVRDWSRHRHEMEQVRAVKPDWYLEEQPPEVVSPWRHHLKKRRLYVEAALQKYLLESDQSQASALLDLGCGDGNNLKYLRKYTFSLYGCDYNLIRLIRAHLRHEEATLFLANVLEFPARDDFFDIVFCNHVIEHIPDDEDVLATVFRILRPGGLLVLGVPNEGTWWWQLAYKLQPGTLHTTDHVHFYIAETVARKVLSAGLELSEIKHLGWGPPVWSWDMRLRKYKWLDDLFELLGKIFIPHQASSLYLLATKPGSAQP